MELHILVNSSVSPPGRVKFAAGTMYRGKVLVKREAFDNWHDEKCREASDQKE